MRTRRAWRSTIRRAGPSHLLSCLEGSLSESCSLSSSSGLLPTATPTQYSPRPFYREPVDTVPSDLTEGFGLLLPMGQPLLRSMIVRRAKGQGRWAQEAGSLSPTALSVSLVADCIWPARVALTDRTREVVAHAATDRSGPNCGNGRGHWTPIAAATPVADHHRDPWWSTNAEPSPSETTSQPWNPLQPNMTGPDG